MNTPTDDIPELSALLWRDHPEPLCLLGANGAIVAANPSFHHHYDFSDDALRGRDIGDLIDIDAPWPEDVSFRPWRAYGTLVNGGGDPERVYVHSQPVRSQPSRDARGRPAALLQVASQRHPSFIGSEQLTRLLGSLDEVIWSLSALTRDVLYISPAVTRSCGYAPELFYRQPQHFFEVIHPDDRDRIVRQIDALVAGGEGGLELTYRIVRADQQIRWLNTRLRLVGDDGPARIDGISKDVTAQTQTEAALRLREARYRAVVEQQVEFICRYRPDGILTFVNEAYCQFFGGSPETLEGTNFYALIPPEERLVVKRNNLRVTPDTPTVVHEHRGLRPDKSGYVWHQWVIRGFFDEHGELIELQAVGRDITRLKQTEAALRRSEALLRGVLDSSLDGIVALEAVRDDAVQDEALQDEAGQIRDFVWRGVNRRAEQILGATTETLAGRRLQEDDTIPLFELFTELARVVESGEPFDTEKYLTHRDQWFRIVAVKLDDGLTATFSDITAKKAHEQELSRLAYYDPLTGLGNRRQLEEHARRLFEDPDARGTVLYLDLDRFKQVNDRYGHKIGDALLEAVAERLRRSLRDQDVVVRLGGDEFAVWLDDTDHARIGATCERIVASLERPFQIEGHRLRIGSSLGYARYPDDGHDLDTLLNRADKAMYRDKNSRR